MMTASAVLVAFGLAGWLQPWSLLTFTFLIGCGTALFDPGWQAAVGDLVPREDITAAVSLNSVGFNLMRSIGPAVGGVIVAFVGSVAAFALNAVSYAPMILGVMSWRRAVETSILPKERFGSAMRAGLRYTMVSGRVLNVMRRSLSPIARASTWRSRTIMSGRPPRSGRSGVALTTERRHRHSPNAGRWHRGWHCR